MVYNKYNKVTGIITVDIKNEKDLTFHTEILNNILEYEKGVTDEFKGISCKEFIQFELGTWETEIGKKISIRTDSGSNLEWDARNDLGTEKSIRNNLNFHFEDEQDGRGDCSESRRSKKEFGYLIDDMKLSLKETEKLSDIVDEDWTSSEEGKNADKVASILDEGFSLIENDEDMKEYPRIRYIRYKKA